MQPFKIDIPQSKLDDLSARLQNINWAADYDNDDWDYGVNGQYLKELAEYWLNDYDWREREQAMNQLNHYRTVIDDVPIHFIHKKGVGPSPRPLILTHGWPWTFWDFEKVIGPLTDPEAYGGDPADAFDVVIPSLPGFTFSNPLTHKGVNWSTTADLWVKLMQNVLGYERFAAHGGDQGALVTTQLGHKHADKLMGIHLINAFPLPAFAENRPWAIGDLVDDSQFPEEALAAHIDWEKRFTAHLAVHSLAPQTLAYAMQDSPLGLCAWLLERRRNWSDCGGDIESVFTKEQLLDNVMLYWLTDSFANSVRSYKEMVFHKWQPEHDLQPPVQAPTGLTLFRHDMPPSADTSWAPFFYNIKQESIHDKGGHFGPAEAPDVVVNGIRSMFCGMS